MRAFGLGVPKSISCEPLGLRPGTAGHAASDVVAPQWRRPATAARLVGEEPLALSGGQTLPEQRQLLRAPEPPSPAAVVPDAHIQRQSASRAFSLKRDKAPSSQFISAPQS